MGGETNQLPGDVSGKAECVDECPGCQAEGQGQDQPPQDAKSDEPSQFSLGVAARIWCEPTTEKITMDTALAYEFARVIERYQQALIWCSRSADFAYGGKARGGWRKICEPLLREPEKELTDGDKCPGCEECEDEYPLGIIPADMKVRDPKELTEAEADRIKRSMAKTLVHQGKTK